VAIRPGVILVSLFGAVAVQAHEPITTKLTWTQEISRIVYKRCASCHHEGGGAFSLATYEEARPWAKAIREEVLERRMPPWGAVEGVGAFRDNPSLTPVEIEMIVNWVEGGAPEGDAVYLPPTPALIPPRQEAAVEKGSITIERGAGVTLKKSFTALAITPTNVPEGASMEVTAYKSDGSVEQLIWVRNYRERWARTYWFRDGIQLAAGTRLAIDAPAPAAAMVSIQ